ncbi:cytochrome c oxidase assembly factor 6 homolog [Amia ocellicauda]|uniref:cytochrome c oxidase assembly factor 6 homolog n=1 Tax=Amia ocellicauda TaxID=2972642 RepID=UPI003464142E|nr:COA6 factor [Amia calva]
MSAPNAEERRVCWRARDELWRCLDENEDKGTHCEKLRKQFESSCPAQWVKYFNKRRDFLKYKERIQTEGFEPVDQSTKL